MIQDVWDDSDELKNGAEMYFSHVSQADLKQIEEARKSEVANHTNNETLHQFFVRVIQRNGLKARHTKIISPR